MTTILAADTATAACSVALSHGEQVFQRCDVTPRSHTQSLLPMVDALLHDAGIRLQDVEAIAFTNGPGSFTGIRIGFGAVQGLALGSGKPVIAISTLALLANTAVRKLKITGETLLLPALDARMDEVYWSAFRVAEGEPVRLQADSLSSPEVSFSGNYPRVSATIAVGEGWQFAERIPYQPDYIDTDLLPEAVDMLTLAQQLFAKGQAVPIDTVQPVYLRDRVSWKKRQRLRT